LFLGLSKQAVHVGSCLIGLEHVGLNGDGEGVLLDGRLELLFSAQLLPFLEERLARLPIGAGEQGQWNDEPENADAERHDGGHQI